MGGVAGRLAERALRSDEVSTPGQLFAQIVKGCATNSSPRALGRVPARRCRGRCFGRTGGAAWGHLTGFPVLAGAACCRLENRGIGAERSTHLALLAISVLEGAIVLARIRQDVDPLDVIVEELAPFFDAAADRRGSPQGDRNG